MFMRFSENVLYKYEIQLCKFQECPTCREKFIQ